MIACTAVQVAAVAPSDASAPESVLASEADASGADESGTLESGVGAVVVLVVVLVGLGAVVVVVPVGVLPASPSVVTGSLEHAA
jgi:hypothetical protein